MGQLLQSPDILIDHCDLEPFVFLIFFSLMRVWCLSLEFAETLAYSPCPLSWGMHVEQS